MSLNSVKTNIKTTFIPLMKPLLAVTMGSFYAISASASTMISATDYLEYELPHSIQEQCYENNNCPKIEVKYLKSNHDWINSIVNDRINNIVINSKPSESPVNQATSTEAAKLAIDDFSQSQFNDMPNDRPWSYELIVKPDYLGHVKLGQVNLGQTEDLELLEISSYVFTGGAHGMPFSEYLIFDPNTKTQVKLDDMLIANKKTLFTALAYDAYKNWVKTIDEDVKNYEQNWPFMFDDNITLTDKGIDIRYQHYAISPYAYGMPILTIPYNKLNGIVKPRFLPKP